MAVTIDQIRLLVRTELEDFEKKIKGAEKQGKDAAKNIESAFKAAFGAIAASKAFQVIGNAFSNAIDASNRFEQALLGVRAAARQTGEDFDVVRDRVLKLTEDGVLGVENVANSFKLLLAQGVDSQQAFDLTEAVKRIASLNNIVGDTSQATQDFFKGILTGSAELVENADPAIRGLVNQFGGLAKVMKDAEARQMFFNAVIERGNGLAEDYADFLQTGAGQLAAFNQAQENLNATIGDTIKDAFTPLLEIATKVINSFIEFFNGLSPITKQIIVFGGAIAALIPALGAALVAVKAFTGLSGLGGLVSLLGGPVGLTIIGTIAAVGALAIAFDKLGRSAEKSVSPLVKSSKEVERAAKLSEQLEKQDRLTTAQKIKLGKANKVLADTAKSLGIALEDENGKLKENKELLTEINEEQVRAAKIRLKQIDIEKKRLIAERSIASTMGIRNELGKKLNVLDEERNELTGQWGDLLKEAKKPGDDLNTNLFVSGDRFKGLKEELRSTSNQLERFLVAAEGRGQEAKAAVIATKLLRITEERLNAERNIIDSFNGEILDQDLRNIEAKKLRAIEAARELARTDLEIKENLQDEIEKIEESARRQRIQAETNALKRQASQVQNVAGSAAGLAGAVRGGNVGGVFGAAGGVFGGAAGAAGKVFGGGAESAFNRLGDVLPIVGGVIGAVGGLVAAFSGIDDRIERQNELTRRHLALLQTQIELERAQQQALAERNKLIDADTQRQITLNNILIENEEERTRANLEAIQNQANVIAGQLGIGAGTPEALIGALAQFDRTRIANSLAIAGLNATQAIANSYANQPLSKAQLLNGYDLLLSQLRSIDLNDVSSGIVSEVNNSINSVQGARALQERIAFGTTTVRGPLIGFNVGRAQNEQTALINRIERSSTLLDLLADIRQTERGLEATEAQLPEAAGLNLQEGRRVSFVDVGRRGVQDLTGQFIGGRPALSLPSAAQGLTVATAERRKSFQERSADALEMSLRELRNQTALLAAIAASVDSSASTDPALAEQFIVGTLNNIAELQVQ